MEVAIIVQVVLAMLIKGGLLSAGFQWLKRKFTWIDAMTPAKKRWALAVVVGVATFLSIVMKDPTLADWTSWDEGTMVGIATFVLTQLAFLAKQAVSKKKA